MYCKACVCGCLTDPMVVIAAVHFVSVEINTVAKTGNQNIIPQGKSILVKE